MAVAARLDFAARRNEARVCQIRLVGLNLTGGTDRIRGQVRLAADTPGEPLIDLAQVTVAGTEGFRFVTLEMVDGAPVSVIELVIAKSTMIDPDILPYMGEVGDSARFSWAVQIDGQTRLDGAFWAVASVIDSDSAPTNRPTSGGYSTPPALADNVTAAFAGDSISIEIDGAAAVGAIAASVADDRAATDAARLAAEAAAASNISSYVARVAAPAGQTFDSPNLAIDADMTGQLGNGWQGADKPTTIVSGRRAIVITNGDGEYREPLTPLAAVGEPFAVGFTLEALTRVSGQVTVLVQQLDGSGALVSGTQDIVFQGVALANAPLRIERSYTRASGAGSWRVYVSIGNSGNSLTLSQLGAYRGGIASHRAALNGRIVDPERYYSNLDAEAKRWEFPNLWRDPKITGLTDAGWNAAVPVVSTRKRRSYRVQGVIRNHDIPAAQIGPAGTVFSASTLVDELVSNGIAVNGIGVSQIAANGTIIGAATVMLASINRSSRARLVQAEAIAVAAGAATIRFYVDASTHANNVIQFSLPDIHVGADASYRAPLPDRKLMARHVASLMAGTTAGRPTGMGGNWFYYDTSIGNFVITQDGGATYVPYAPPGGGTPTPTPSVADYYVDSAGSDSNAGTTQAAPFLTFQKAIDAVGVEANKTIGVKKGSVFTAQPIRSFAPGLKWIGYGDSATHWRVLGVAGRTDHGLISGTVYSMAATAEPQSVSVVAPDGATTKLYFSPGGSATPAVGRWTWATGVLYLNAGFALTGYTIYPTRNVNEYPFWTGAANQEVHNAEWLFWGRGTKNQHANNWLHNCRSNHGGDDGFDQEYGATGFRLTGERVNGVWLGQATDNGRAYNAGQGPGDGSSHHDLAQGKIDGMYFARNTQTGVGGFADCDIEVTRCMFVDNQVDFQIYNSKGGSTGDHTVGRHVFAYNIINRSRAGIFVNVAATDTTVPNMAISIHNNTMWQAVQQTTDFCKITINGGTVDWANNIVNSNGAQFGAARYGGTVTDRNSTYFGHTSAQWQTGQAAQTRTGNFTRDPLLVDPANGNFALQSGSSERGSGIALTAAYGSDHLGTAIANPPSRGAVEYAG